MKLEEMPEPIADLMDVLDTDDDEKNLSGLLEEDE